MTGNGKTIYIIVAVLTLLLPPAGLLSQNPSWMYWDPWNAPIPSRIINDIAIDDLGLKWIGTEPVCGGGICTDGGLAVFDGTDWTVYDSLNSSLNSNFISTIAIDTEGLVWVGTAQGEVSSFDGTSWLAHPFPTTVNVPVTAIDIDLYGQVWAGTGGDGLYLFDGDGWAHFHQGNSPLTNYLSSVAAGPDNTVWAGGNADKLFKYTGSWSVIPLPEEMIFTSAIAADQENRIWVGSDGQLCNYYAGIWTVCDEGMTGIPDSALGYVFDIAFDNNGNTWIGHSMGLIKFNGSEWSSFGPANSGLRSEHILSLAADEPGNLWIGTADTGLIAYHEGGVVRLSEGQDPRGNERAILLPPYPNPSESKVNIRLSLTENCRVYLYIADMVGRTVAVLMDGTLDKGAHEFIWNGGGRTGIYLVGMSTGQHFLSRKIVLRH